MTLTPRGTRFSVEYVNDEETDVMRNSPVKAPVLIRRGQLDWRAPFPTLRGANAGSPTLSAGPH